ncbi:MAG: SemiSWEET transporter [Chitinophagaceae bacterium]
MLFSIETIVGVAAGILTASSMLPQLIKTFKKKQAEDVSVVMLLVLISGICLWIYYGIMKTDWPIILTNAFSLLLNIIMIILRMMYKKV